MPVVKVETPKNSTVPKSAKVSIKANTTPATIAGRAIGIASRIKLCIGVRPRVRPTSKVALLCDKNEARANKKT